MYCITRPALYTPEARGLGGFKWLRSATDPSTRRDETIRTQISRQRKDFGEKKSEMKVWVAAINLV